VEISVNLSGLRPFSKHGLHIHTKGDIREGCNATGFHYNPFDQAHGSLDSEVRHIGDLGNVEANKNGNVVAEIPEVRDMHLLGPFSVVGRGCVIHKNEDDLGLGNNEWSKRNGNS
jgi:Cu-Zn family superoxide dismutase